MIRRLFALLLILLIGSSCGRWPLSEVYPPPAGSATPTVLLPTTTTAFEATPTSEETAAPQEVGILRVWVPPQFDPSANTTAAILLRSRLNEFVTLHPGLRLEVRVKALSGPAGLLGSLTTASAAAPLALPDVIALPRPLLEAAALKGLLRPYDGLTTSLDAPDWYDYARQLARLENSTFGLPFAGDALLLVYRTGLVSEAPRDWEGLLKTGLPLAFPAADSQALFPLNLYRSTGGAVQDEQGRPTLDTLALTQVLTFTLAAGQSGIMPNSLTLYETYDQSWNAFQEGTIPMTIAWASRFLSQPEEGVAAALLPTPTGTPYTLANGWVWAIASPQPERQKLAIQLAEALTDGNFLARWCPAAGYLPTRSSALTGWSAAAQQSLLGQIVQSAQLYPSADILDSLGLPLEEALLKVLKLQADPATAAQQAAKGLQNP